MLRPDRQKKIKEWILSEKSLKIGELSEQLGVSEMTIHRDLKPLIEEGLIVKTFGGIMWSNLPGIRLWNKGIVRTVQKGWMSA